MRDLRVRRRLGCLGGGLGLATLAACDVDAPDEGELVGVAQQAVLGGVEDTAGSVPNVVRIQNTGCTGTLITPNVVLLAAHCQTIATTKFGCSPWLYDQTTDIGSAVRVLIPPPGSANLSDPNVRQVAVDAIGAHPANFRDVASECCPGVQNPDATNCAYCDFNTPGLGINRNRAHDLAVVHLAEPVTDIAPSKVLRRLGPRLEAIGRYPVTASGIVGKQIVFAGTSATSQTPTGRVRAYATAQLSDLAFPWPGDAELYTPPGAGCSVPTITNWAVTGATALHLNTQNQPSCPIKGDSGGPVFLNRTDLGGDPIAGLLPAEAVIAGVSSTGSATVALGCTDDSRYTATWDFEYALDGNPVAGTNGSWIDQRMRDFDGDGVDDVIDNCVTAPNPDQANCNADAEEARGYPPAGDACDPIPCPAATPQEPDKHILLQQGDGSGFFTTTFWQSFRDTFDIDPLASNYVGNGSGQFRDVPGVTVGSVQTLYHFCQKDAVHNINCGAGAINDIFLSPIEGVPDPSRPFHVARVASQSNPTPVSSEVVSYTDADDPYTRTWQYEDDAALWEANSWIDAVAGCSIVLGNCSTNLDGRFWVHASTSAGTFSSPVGSPGSGFRVNDEGNASAASDEDGSGLANHYDFLAPDAVVAQVVSQPVQDDLARYFDFRVCDPLIPGWDGVQSEASTLIQLPLGRFGVLLRDGSAVAIDDKLQPNLRARLASGVVWASAAEASMFQGQGRFDVVALAADGTDVVDAVRYDLLKGAGSTADFGGSITPSVGPAARRQFATAYSRVEDRVFVVGGLLGSSNTPANDIWMRSAMGTMGWEPVPLHGYQPDRVLAATYSFADAKLWVLDLRVATNKVRLFRIDPFLGTAERVGSWTRRPAWTKFWLVLDPNGQVVLAASSATHHAVARFHALPFEPVKPTLDRFTKTPGELLLPPVYDTRGYTLVLRTTGSAIPTVERHSSLGGVTGDSVLLEDVL